MSAWKSAERAGGDWPIGSPCSAGARVDLVVDVGDVADIGDARIEQRAAAARARRTPPRAGALPTCARSYTVGPHTYIRHMRGVDRHETLAPPGQAVVQIEFGHAVPCRRPGSEATGAGEPSVSCELVAIDRGRLDNGSGRRLELREGMRRHPSAWVPKIRLRKQEHEPIREEPRDHFPTQRDARRRDRRCGARRARDPARCRRTGRHQDDARGDAGRSARVRSGVDHGEHQRLPRLHDLRHAVRQRRQFQPAAADGRQVRGCRTTRRPTRSNSATASSGTTAPRSRRATASPRSAAGARRMVAGRR